MPLPELLGTPTPQPTPTPLGSTLNYEITNNQFEVTLAPGQVIAGTQLQFIGKQSNVFTVSIDGLTAGKQEGDSFNWQGIIGPGATADYRLNLLPTFTDNELKANGNVTITIFEPEPKESGAPQRTDQVLQFDNMPLDFIVPVGGTIPGTTLVFEGESNNVVTFSGTQGLPTYILGDSVLWNGFLRDNIYVLNNLEIKQMEPNGLHVAGNATLWIYRAPVTPSQ